MRYIFFFCLFFMPSFVNAQFAWNTIEHDYDGRYYYCIDGLDCNGANCSAVGTFIDALEHRFYRVIFRSTDQGVSWMRQDPKLAVDTAIDFNFLSANYFTSIQQIDSLNICATGIFYNSYDTMSNGASYRIDSPLVIRSFDAGKTWNRQMLPMKGIAVETHFSDPLNGIILTTENTQANSFTFGHLKIFITSNGGIRWDSTKKRLNIGYTTVKTHCYGNNRYSIFKLDGPIYTTTDNWLSVDSTAINLKQSLDDVKTYYHFNYCAFGSGDTLIAYGSYFKNGDYRQSKGLLRRSIDNGKTWEKPLTFDSVWAIQKMSSIDRDTILAGGPSFNKILRSTDRGTTWRTDSLFLDTSYPAYALRGIGMTGSGNPIAAYGFENTEKSIPSLLIRGVLGKNSVHWSGQIDYHQRIYPNPATTTLHIVSVEGSTPFRIMDILGRIVISGRVLDQATLTVDVSLLPKGVYFVFVDDIRDGHPINVGKVLLTGK